MGVDPFEKVALGRSGLHCTRVGLGTAALGNLYSEVSDADAEGVIRRAVQSGINLLDTAPLYGYGLAERRLGSALGALEKGSAGAPLVATKAGRLLRFGAPPDPSQWKDGQPVYVHTPDIGPVFDFSSAGIRRSVHESLERLELDRLDIVHLHDPDEHFEDALLEAYPALVELREEGLVRAISVGMNQAPMLARFAKSAAFDCVLIAGRYSLLDQSGAAELFPLCAERGIGIVVGGVFNSGVLADPRPGARFDYAPVSPEVLTRAMAMADVCERHGVGLKAAALQFPFGHPAVTCVLVGARSTDELDEDLNLLCSDVPPEVWMEMKYEGLLPADCLVPWR